MNDRRNLGVGIALASVLHTGSAAAENEDALAKMARKARDPLGRTFLLRNGDGLDLSIGGYALVERPQNAPKWQLKFGVSYFFN